MPNGTDKGNGGGGGDDAAAKAAADKAAADKAAADAAAAAGDETVTIKKSELEKIKSDRDNYKASLLVKKADERGLGGDGGKKDDKGGGGDGQPQIDTKEIVTQASTAVLSTLADSNEKRAKRKFLRDHPEYLEDAAWAELMTHWSSKRGKATVEDILEDFEDTVILHKRSTGKLDEYLKSERERGRLEGRREAEIRDLHGAGGAGERQGGGEAGAKLTPEGEQMAQRMHVDPKKAAEIQKELPRSDEGGYVLPVGKK